MAKKKKQKNNEFLYSIWQSVSNIPGWLRFLWLTDYFTEIELDELAMIDDEFLRTTKALQNDWYKWKRKNLPKIESDWLKVFPSYKRKKKIKRKYSNFSQDEIEVARNVDLISVIEEYVDLQESGTNRLVGTCPFHNDSNPSFTIYEDSNRFFCFGCQENGDVITFIRNIEKLTFKQAIRILNRYSDSLKKI